MTLGAGGTPGGLGSFLAGLVMAVGGSLLLTHAMTIPLGLGQGFGPYGLRISSLPLLLGAGLLFFDGRSRVGWGLIACGAAAVLLGVLTHLRTLFEPTRLVDTLSMLVLLAGGLGLLGRSLNPQPPPAS